jgi:hypothetical protein
MSSRKRRPAVVNLRLWRPHAGQIDIVEGAARFNVVVCGRRWGKSIMGEDRIVPVAAQGGPTAWFAPDYKSLLEVWRDLSRILEPLISRRDTQQKRLELYTGGVLEFWSLDGDPEQCRGRHYKRIVIDEAAKVRHLELAWTQAIRPTLMDYRGDAWFLTTPRGRDFLWELWQRGLPEQRDRWKKWRCWQKPTATNPYILASEIEEMRAELPTTVFNQEVLAEFLDVGGRFFDEWEPERGIGNDRYEWHVVTPFRLNPDTHRWSGGLDFGTRAPFSFHLIATTRSGDPIICDEEYTAGLLPKAQAERVVACLARNNVPKDSLGRFRCVIAADPSMFPPKDPEQRYQAEYPSEAFRAAGLDVRRAINDRRATNLKARQWIHEFRVETDPLTGRETAVPRLRVFAGRCLNLIRQIPLMITSEHDPEDFEHGEHGEPDHEDHAVDSGLRYGLGSIRLKPPTPVPAKQDDPHDQTHLPHELRSAAPEPERYE